MFDFYEIFNFGKETEVNGEKWLSIKTLQNRCHLAIKKDSTLPCQVFLIQTPEVLKNGNGDEIVPDGAGG